jgi:hypothetical protein
MARKPLFEDIEENFLGVSRPKNPFRPVAASNSTGIESEISTTKAFSSKGTISRGDEAPPTEEALEKEITDSKEIEEYVCRGQSCNYRGKALFHWKIHARHSGHLSFGCDLVQGDSSTYIPYEGTTDSAKEELVEPANDILGELLEVIAGTHDSKMQARSKLSESGNDILEEAVKNMTKDQLHLFSGSLEFFNHLEQHRKDRSRLSLLTLTLVLTHSLIWYNHYDVGYEPNNPVNIISVLLVGYVIMSFGFALYDKFSWDKNEPNYHKNLLSRLIIQLVGIAGILVFSESMILHGFIALMFIGSYVNTANEVSTYVFVEKIGISGLYRVALSVSYQAMLVAACSFLLAAADNYLIG